MQNAIRQVYEKLAKFRSVVSCKLDMVKSEARGGTIVLSTKDPTRIYATNIGSSYWYINISMTPYLCKILYMNELIFQFFLKFEPKLA